MKAITSEVSVTAERALAYLDLTEDLRRAIKDAGVTEGCAVAFCAHTTCALLINEWESGALEDFRRRLASLVPSEEGYLHDDLELRTENVEVAHERPNGRAHVAQMLLGATSHAIPVTGGDPLLGRWQRLLLLELDEPKERRIVFHVFGD